MPITVRRVLPVVVLLVLPAVVASAQQAEQGEGASSAEAIYIERCASCHGRNLEGGNAQSMVDGVWLFGRSDGDLTRNIKFGISSVGMPDYKDSLSDRQIRQLVEYIKDAQDRLGVERPPIPESLQTRHYDVGVTKWVADGLEVPWALVFIDQNTALVTERPGRLRVVLDGVLHPDAIRNTPEVLAVGQGGLLDVALDPNHDENGWVYLSYSHALDGETGGNARAMTRVVRGRIRDHAWVDEQVVYAAAPKFYSQTRHHYGSRFAFDHEGRLLFSIGDRGVMEQAQDPQRPNGKIHRVWPDGSVPDDNPFAGGEQGLPTVFTYGNRNAQGLAVHPITGEVWETEHGPMGGDEVNLLEAGKNYGWPIASYGIDYSGTSFTNRLEVQGTEQPVWYWVPSIAVCGTRFCTGEEFPRWEHNLLVGGLAHEEVRRLVIDHGRVIHQELLLKNAGRVRDVQCDPSGAVYVVLNNPDIVLKLTNEGEALRQ